MTIIYIHNLSWSGTGYRGAYYGQGSGGIYLDVVDCEGTETDLGLCRNGGWVAEGHIPEFIPPIVL